MQLSWLGAVAIVVIMLLKSMPMTIWAEFLADDAVRAVQFYLEV